MAAKIAAFLITLVLTVILGVIGFALLMLALNGYSVRAVPAAAGATCGTARFTAGRDACNRLD